MKRWTRCWRGLDLNRLRVVFWFFCNKIRVLKDMVNTSSTKWVMDCMQFHGKVLSGEKAHWCFDWDDLPIDETLKSYISVCTCDLD